MTKKFLSLFLIISLFITLLPLLKVKADSEKVLVIVQLKSPSYSEFLSENKDVPMTNSNKNSYLNLLEKEHNNFLFSLSSKRIYFKERWHYYLSYNGVSGEVLKDDIEKIKKIPYVKNVYLSQTHYLDTDIFVPLINAPEVWEMSDENGLSVTGKGMLIGIIDSGIDYNHPDLKNNLWTNPNEISDNKKDDDNNGYVDDVMGWDFINDDNDPMDDEGHGTSVAGIIAANGKVKGVAPDAKIVSFKVFSSEGYGTEDGYMKALELALLYGCHVVNYSGGSIGGKSEGTPELDATNNAVNLGLIVVASAGNEGLRSKEASWPIAAPSSAKNAISCAASDEGGGTVNIVYPTGFEDKFIPYSYGSDVPEFQEGKEYELVYCGYGRDKDFEGKDLKGKLALIQRGPLAPESALLFETKYFNALANGAEGVVVFNTAPGPLIKMALNVQNHPGVELKPAVFIMEEDGYFLKSLIESGLKLSFTRKLRKQHLVAEFSSQGPTSDNCFKPDICNPGTNTFTTALGGGYTYGFSGTSGASPFTAGPAILLKQLHPDWTPEDVKTALMNNAFILINPNNNLPFTWTDQGSGRVDVYAAATTPLLIKPYSIFIMDKEGKIDIKVKNLLNNDIDIKVSSNLISQVTGITFDFLNKEDVFTVKANEELVIPFNYIVDDKTPEGYYDAVVYFSTNDRTLHIPIVIKKGIPKVPTKILDDISIEPRKISPNGDGVEDTIKFHFKLNYGEIYQRNNQNFRSRVGGVVIDVLDEKGTTKLGTIYKKVLMNGVYDFIWDGRDFEGKFFLSNGRYQYKIYCVTIQSGDQLQLIEEGAKTGYFTVEGVVFPSTKIETRDSVAKNTEFFFDVGVKAAPDLKIVSSELTFDPEYLEVVDVLPGDFLKEGGSDVNVEYTVDKEYGKIKVRVTRVNEKGITGEGTVFRIKFKAIKDGGTRIAVSSFVGFDSQNRPLDFLLIEKVIKITLLMGDINDDGKVNSEDLIIFAQSFGTKIGDTYYNEKCDLNGDGKVDADDLLLLAKNFGTSAP